MDQCVRPSALAFSLLDNRGKVQPQTTWFNCSQNPKECSLVLQVPVTDSDPQGRALVQVNLSPSKKQGLRAWGMGLASCNDHPAWRSVCASMSSAAAWGLGGSGPCRWGEVSSQGASPQVLM